MHGQGNGRVQHWVQWVIASPADVGTMEVSPTLSHTLPHSPTLATVGGISGAPDDELPFPRVLLKQGKRGKTFDDFHQMSLSPDPNTVRGSSAHVPCSQESTSDSIQDMGLRLAQV